MDVTPLIPKDRQVIQSYTDGGFRVSGKAYKGAIIVFPEMTIPWDAPSSFSELETTHFDIFSGDLPEVILLGTGKTHKFFRPAQKKALKDKGLNIETMDSGAACRTYNVLMAEGRRVAAALLPST